MGEHLVRAWVFSSLLPTLSISYAPRRAGQWARSVIMNDCIDVCMSWLFARKVCVTAELLIHESFLYAE